MGESQICTHSCYKTMKLNESECSFWVDLCSADFCPRVSRLVASPRGSQWLFEIGFLIRPVFGRFATIFVQTSVAVLMAVRC